MIGKQPIAKFQVNTTVYKLLGYHQISYNIKFDGKIDIVRDQNTFSRAQISHEN